MSNNENNEKSEPSHAPSGGINTNMKMEILLFKNEVLTDIKNTEKIIVDRYTKLNDSLEEKFIKYESELESLKVKIEGINIDKSNQIFLKDNVNKLLSFSDKTKDDLITADIKINNLEKDIFNNVYRIDKILSESVIYPGVIGGISKFKSFHDFMDYLLSQASQNITFRDRSQMDLKSYKIKLENLIKNFKTQLDNLMKDANSFTKRSIAECEDRIKLLFDRVDERIRETRVENANFMLDFQKTVDDLKTEIANVGEIKNEILKKLDENLLLTKHENKKVIDNFGNYKKDFNIMKDRLTQLSGFIKDIRFRTNIKKAEFFDMAKKINFDKIQVIKDGKYIESDDLLKDDWFKNKSPIIYESGLKKYIKGEINANEIGIITAKDKRQLNNSNIMNNLNNSMTVNNNVNNNEINNYEINNSDEKMENNINNEKIKKIKSKNKNHEKQKNKANITNIIANNNIKNKNNNIKMKKIKKVKNKKKKNKSKNENGITNEEDDKNEEEEEEIEIEEDFEDEIEENEEENSEGTEEESEEDSEEESEEDSNQNLSCDYLDEYSYENDEQNENDIIKTNKGGMKRRKSKIGLPLLKSRKRGTSATNKNKKQYNSQKKNKIKEKNYYTNYGKGNNKRKYNYNNSEKYQKRMVYKYANKEKNQNNFYNSHNINQQNTEKYNNKINNNSNLQSTDNLTEKYTDNLNKQNNSNLNKNINNYNKHFSNEEKLKKYSPKDNNIIKEEENYSNNSLKEENYEMDTRRSIKSNKSEIININHSNFNIPIKIKNKNIENQVLSKLNSKFENNKENYENIENGREKIIFLNNNKDINKEIRKEFSKEEMNSEVEHTNYIEENNMNLKNGANINENNKENYANNNNLIKSTNYKSNYNNNFKEKNKGTFPKNSIIENKNNEIISSQSKINNENYKETKSHEINYYYQKNNFQDLDSNNIVYQKENNNNVKNCLTRNNKNVKNYSNSADYINEHNNLNIQNSKNNIKYENKEQIISQNNNMNNKYKYNNIPPINLRNNRLNNNINEMKEKDFDHNNNKNNNFNRSNQINGINKNSMNYANRSTIINGNREDIIYNKNTQIIYQKKTNNTGNNLVRNASSDFLYNSKRKFNLAENNTFTQKNGITNRTYKNGELSKLKPNYSNLDINNNKQTKSFFGISNNIFNIHASNSVIIGQNQNYNFSDSINNYQSNYNRSFPLINKALDNLDKNININEKVISSPFQVYKNQKGKKGNNSNNKINQSLNLNKRVLFDIKEKDKKNINNLNNNYQNTFFNLKGKEALILQSLVNNLQSNIPEYEKQFINEDDIKNMKNKRLEKK